MKISKRFLFVFSFLVLLLGVNSGEAQPVIEDETVPIIYPRAQHPPTIDGMMDSLWYNAPRYPMAHIASGDPDDWYDLSGEWRAIWDDENIYYFIEVRDDVINIGLTWEWDSVEIYFDGDYSNTTEYDGFDDVQLRFHYGDPDRTVTVWTNEKGPEFDTSEMIWEEMDTDHGYLLELSIPFEALFIDNPEPGMIFGVEVQYNDNDEGSTCDHKLISFGEVEDHWFNPSSFGAAVLSDWIVSDTLSVVRTGVQPIIDAELDEVWKEVPPISATGYLSWDNIYDLYDLSMTTRVMWDADYIYEYVEVWDDFFSRDGSGNYEDDGIELYFDGDYSHGTAYDGINDIQIAFCYQDDYDILDPAHLVGMSANTNFDLSGIMQASRETLYGVVLEVAFPMSLVDINPVAGSIFGIEMDYNDDDQETGSRDTKLKTYSKGDDTWQNPSMMVPAKLVVTPKVAVEKEHIATQIVDFLLKQNYPNPFNPTTRIEYAIPKTATVKLVVVDVLGREIQTLVNEEKSAGLYKIEFNGSELASGVYFYKLVYGNQNWTQKMMLMK